MKHIVKSYDTKYAKNYRQSDNCIQVNQDYWILREFISNYFNQINKIKKDVLDLGCGTGRYFHVFNGGQINRFVGIDISKPMIEIAQNNPPFKDEISIKKIELICGDFQSINNIGKFDFVYSIGVLGEHMPFNGKICSKIANEFLNVGGLFISTAVCWFHRTFKRRFINCFLEKFQLADFGFNIGLYRNFFNTDLDIIKSLQQHLN